VAQLLTTEKKTIYRRSDVKLLKKSREMKQFLSVAPLLLTGIHVTSDNNHDEDRYMQMGSETSKQPSLCQYH
jgi:hypothetical protein